MFESFPLIFHRDNFYWDLGNSLLRLPKLLIHFYWETSRVLSSKKRTIPFQGNCPTFCTLEFFTNHYFTFSIFKRWFLLRNPFMLFYQKRTFSFNFKYWILKTNHSFSRKLSNLLQPWARANVRHRWRHLLQPLSPDHLCLSSSRKTHWGNLT